MLLGMHGMAFYGFCPLYKLPLHAAHSLPSLSRRDLPSARLHIFRDGRPCISYLSSGATLLESGLILLLCSSTETIGRLQCIYMGIMDVLRPLPFNKLICFSSWHYISCGPTDVQNFFLISLSPYPPLSTHFNRGCGL